MCLWLSGWHLEGRRPFASSHLHVQAMTSSAAEAAAAALQRAISLTRRWLLSASVSVSEFKRAVWPQYRVGRKQGWHENTNDIYNEIYHDSIMIFSSENIIDIFLYFWYFQNVNLYYYYLLSFLIHAYLTQTAQVHKLLGGGKTLTLWSVGRNNVTDDRHRRTAHAIRRT